MTRRVSSPARCLGLLAAVAAAHAAGWAVACAGRGPMPGAGSEAVRAGRPFDDCAGAGWCPRLVAIPAGRFVRGAPASEAGRADTEGPPRPVTVRRFAAGAYPVTRGEWAAFAAATGRPTRGGCAWAMVGGMARGYTPALDTAASWAHVGFPQDARHPVVCVTWDDARAYAAWLRARTGQPYRLLSEAEWEYAARAGTTTAYPWGDAASHERANYGAERCCTPLTLGRDAWIGTSPVGAFPANAFGLFDMPGNVLQWVADCYAPSYAGAPADGSADTADVPLPDGGNRYAPKGRSCDHRVLRGGDWGDPPRMLRSAFRNTGPGPGATLAAYRSAGVGFRVARDLP